MTNTYVDFTQYNSSKTNSMTEKFKTQFQRLSSSSRKNKDDIKFWKSNEKRNSAKETVLFESGNCGNFHIVFALWQFFTS